MNNLYKQCTLCPHHCQADRLNGQPGLCQAPPRPKVAKIMLHMWEEPCVSGSKGSGAVFFSHCNLGCIFCQNYQISHLGEGLEVSEEELAEKFIDLQSQGAQNINLVSPTPYHPSVIIALKLAKAKGLSIPVVYNTNAYEETEAIDLLEGLVDIYLPDLKYYYASTSKELSGVEDYFIKATAAILKMFSQVGPTRIQKDGMMNRGLLIRHLILPGYLEDSKRILEWIGKNLPHSVYISLMSQYFPSYQGKNHPVLNRTLTVAEYDEMIDYFWDLGLENGFMQEISSATANYVPDFNG